MAYKGVLRTRRFSARDAADRPRDHAATPPEDGSGAPTPCIRGMRPGARAPLRGRTRGARSRARKPRPPHKRYLRAWPGGRSCRRCLGPAVLAVGAVCRARPPRPFCARSAPPPGGSRRRGVKRLWRAWQPGAARPLRRVPGRPPACPGLAPGLPPGVPGLGVGRAPRAFPPRCCSRPRLCLGPLSRVCAGAGPPRPGPLRGGARRSSGPGGRGRPWRAAFWPLAPRAPGSGCWWFGVSCGLRAALPVSRRCASPGPLCGGLGSPLPPPARPPPLGAPGGAWPPAWGSAPLLLGRASRAPLAAPRRAPGGPFDNP